jgi:integrase
MMARSFPTGDERREILIERALSAGQVGTTKTGRARLVDMSPELCKALRERHSRRERERLLRGWPEVPEWVFVNSRGKLLDESLVRYRFAQAMRRAGLSGHRLYDLRHSYASIQLARGVPLTYVAAQLGHVKPTTTLQWYARWLPRPDKSYVEGLPSGQKGSISSPLAVNLAVNALPLSAVRARKSLKRSGEPPRTRTWNPLIKSQLLYRLS